MKQTIFVLALVILAACGQEPPDSVPRQQLESANAQNQQLAEELQRLRLEIVGEPPPAVDGACPRDVRTRLYDEKGKTCADLEGQVRGYAELCVKEGACDPTERLREAKASADATCQAFCKRHECEEHFYDGPTECANRSPCFVRPDSCPAECPAKDVCYLEQGDYTPNCWCTKPAL